MVDLLGTGLSGLITLVAAFGGIFLGGMNQRRADLRAADREDAKYQREVNVRLEEDRRRDQLDLLRAVQEDVLRASRSTVRLLSLMRVLRGMSGDDSALPRDARPELYEARTQLVLHASRVLDDKLRADLVGLLDEITVAAADSTVIPESGTAAEADAADGAILLRIERQQSDVINALGAAIRAEVAGSPAARHTLPE